MHFCPFRNVNTGEMCLWLKALVAPKGPCFISQHSYNGSQPSETPVPRNLVPSSDRLRDQPLIWFTYMYADKPGTHKMNKLNVLSISEEKTHIQDDINYPLMNSIPYKVLV